MQRGIGQYAAVRPEKVQQYSSEFKRDLLDLNPHESSKSAKKKKKKSRDSSSDSSSNSDSSSSSDSEAERRRRIKKNKRKSSDKHSKDDDKKRRRRRRKKSDSHEVERRRTRRPSGAASSDRNRRASRQTESVSSDSSYKSPSEIENDSDLESDGLEMKHEIEPLICYLREDRELFNKQIFKIIRGRRRQHLMPKVLRNINDKELKQTCLTELARWSNKRLRILMRTGKLLESEDEEAIAPLPKIEDSDDEMKAEEKINGTVTAEKVMKSDETGENGDKAAEASKNGENVDKSEKPRNDNSETDSDSKTRKKSKKSKKSKRKTDTNQNNSSDEEDIKQMKANLAVWRKNKIETEMVKLREKQAAEILQHEQEILKEQEMLQRELEDKKLAKKKIEELSQKLDDVGKEIAKQEGLVLVEKMTLRKSSSESADSEDELEKKKMDEAVGVEKMEDEESDEDVDSEGNLVVKKRSAKPKMVAAAIGKKITEDRPEADDMSLDVDDGDSSEQSDPVGSINHDLNKPEKPKKEKKPKKKKAEKPSKATKPAKEGEQRENLCPNTPYNPKKYRRHMVKDWLASLGREGPALPVPDNDFYPDYADPNMANAMAEIEDLQEAYDLERRAKGRTDGKQVVKITGEEVFDLNERAAFEEGKRQAGFDEIDPNDKNAVAKRMLQTMLKRNSKTGDKDKACQPDFSRPDDTKYTDVTPSSYPGIGPGIPEKFQTSLPDKELVRVAGSRGWVLKDKDEKSVAAKGASLTKINPTEKDISINSNTGSGGCISKSNPLDANRTVFDTRKINPEQTRREKAQKLETEMRARAIKKMMERMQSKDKVKKETVVKKEESAVDGTGHFPWQDEDVDDF